MAEPTEAQDVETDDLRHTSRRLGQALAGLAVALAVLIVLERFGALAFHAGAYRDGATGSDWLLALAKALPEALVVVALWWIRGALAAFASGEYFTPALAQALRRTGIALAIAAAFVVAVLPSIARALGQPPGYLIALDVNSFALGAVGIALTLISHVLRRAAALQAELDEIF